MSLECTLAFAHALKQPCLLLKLSFRVDQINTWSLAVGYAINCVGEGVKDMQRSFGISSFWLDVALAV